MLRVQLTPNETDKRDYGNNGKPDDVISLEPILLLAPFEHELERTDACGQKADARPVDLFDHMRHLRLIDEAQRRPDGDQANGDVDEKTPLPGEVIHQPAAKQRADGRAEHEAHRKDACRRAALLGLEGFIENRLRGRQESAAADALNEAEKDQHPDVSRDAAEKRGDRKEQDRADEVGAPPEKVAEESRQRNDDDVGDGVTRDDVRDILDARAEVAADVVQGDVDDGGVDQFKHGRHDDRHRDDPLPDAGLVVILRRLSARNGFCSIF